MEINTVQERDLILSELTDFKRSDFDNIRPLSLEFFKNNKDLSSFEKEIKNLSVVNITLAVEPSVSIVNYISDFMKKKIKVHVLMDFEIDRNLIGGAVIIYKGKYINSTILEKLSHGRI